MPEWVGGLLAASYQCTLTGADWEKRLNEPSKMSSSVLISNAGDEIRDNDPREMRLKI